MTPVELTPRERSIATFALHHFADLARERMEGAAQKSSRLPASAVEAFHKDAKDAEALEMKLRAILEVPSSPLSQADEILHLRRDLALSQREADAARNMIAAILKAAGGEISISDLVFAELHPKAMIESTVNRGIRATRLHLLEPAGHRPTPVVTLEPGT